MPPLPQTDLSDRFGRKMVAGYRQNTFGFGQYLHHSKDLQKVLSHCAYRIALHYRNNAPRGRSADMRSADTVKIFPVRPGGKHGDRQAVHVRARFKNKAGMRTMKNAPKAVSGGRKIDKWGHVSG